MEQQWIEAGLLMRGKLRLALVKAGIRFTETKRLTESVFIIDESSDVYHRLCRELRRQGVAS